MSRWTPRLWHQTPRLVPSPSTQRQRLINLANGVSSKPLQNGRQENVENGNVPVENPEDPPREREQEPQPPAQPPPEAEPEPTFLSPFSTPGECPVRGCQDPGLLHGERPCKGGLLGFCHSWHRWAAVTFRVASA